MQEAADRVDSSLRETRAARGEGNLPLRRGVLVAIDGAARANTWCAWRGASQSAVTRRGR